MKLQLLFFEGCPHWREASETLRDALRLEGLEQSIELVEIGDDTDAAEYQFLGSPSIHINGEDLWPFETDQHRMSCRMYDTPEGRRGAPTIDMIRRRLRELGQ